MAACIKYQWYLAKYAKFVFSEEDKDTIEDDIAEILDVPCKGKWKVYTGKDRDLMLCFLESDHFLITHNEIILESFSLVNSKTWIKGVAKKDTLLILNKLKGDNNRRFRIQFHGDESDRIECTEILRKYFPICEYDAQTRNMKPAEIANINQIVFNKQKFLKGYDLELSDENLKEITMLCLTDTTFPSYVAKVHEILKNIGK